VERKLYIINNGMKDRRGHYLETAVSVAEASWGLGLRPVLAAHVSCPRDLVPSGIEFHPVFTTDHWMTDVPPPPLALPGIRGELALLLANPIEALCEGTVTFDQYLRAQFILDNDPEQELFEPEPVARTTSWADRRTELKRLVRAFLPPALYNLLRFSRFLLRGCGRGLKTLLRLSSPPLIWNRLRALLKPEPVVEPPPPPPVKDPLEIQFERLWRSEEFAYCLRFKQDLERLLSLTGCTAGDHVFLPTAHGRELGAIAQLLSTLPTESRPTFHLEFRHSLDMTSPHAPHKTEHPFTTVHRAYFDHARRFAPTDRLRLYTDSEELSEDYERFSGLDFGVLPIPFRTRLLSNPRRKGSALCLAFFGDVREEKGFHWLPGLIEALMPGYVIPGRVRFLIQASLVHPEGEPSCNAALHELMKLSEDHVRLVGLDGPLPPDLYYELVSEADLLLCPYDPGAYRCRSSGTLTEAISAGIPTVVPDGTWLARQQPTGSGARFVDAESFHAAVKQVCDHYATYHVQARAARKSWLAQHSPERLVQALLGHEAAQSERMGKVA
jgi:glycosyltransferase involved in cell wall biosynthesis